MGKTYHKNSKRFDDELSSGRSGKHAKRANNKKTGGMRTLNSYADEDFDLNDEVEIDDEIYIQYIKNDTP